MITLYRHALSGHSHRVELFLTLLDLDFKRVDVDLVAGAHKEHDFLRLNRFGQVPVIDDDGVIVSDSNAILIYLAAKYDDGNWYPRDAVAAAEVQKWLSVAAGLISYGPAAARLVTVFDAGLDHAHAKSIASGLFDVMENHLAARWYLAGDGPTISDLACYTYIAHAPEGGVSLTPYPNVRRWLARIEALPRFVAMQKTPVALAA